MFKPCLIRGKSLDDAYFQLLYKCYNTGRVTHIDTGSFAGSDRLELDFASGIIEDITSKPIAPIFPPGVPPTTNDDEIEKYFANYLMDGNNLSENEHYRYSTFINGGKYRLPLTNTIMNVPSQIEWVIDHYKKKGFGNNHGTLQIGYPESNMAYDEPYENEVERNTSPCLRIIDTKIVEDDEKHKLCMNVLFRSWDLYAAFPENMGGMILLMEYIASELDISTGYLGFTSSKLHCYSSQIEAVKARLKI